MTPCALFVFSACATVLFPGPPPEDWPQWRGPARDGRAPALTSEMDWVTNPPRLLWTAEGTGRGYASVSVVGERIFTTGDRPDGQYVVALNRANGDLLWARKLTDKRPRHGFSGSRCTPAVDENRLYAVTSNGSIACLDAESGLVHWQRDFKDWGGFVMSNWGFSESPLVDGPLVLCTPGGTDAVVVALDKLTGKQVWATPAPPATGAGKDGAGYASLVISQAAGVKQYVTLVGRGVIGIRASDGGLLWTYNRVANSTANIPTPICHGDYVFCSSGYGAGAALLHLTADGGGVTATEKYFLPGTRFQNHHGGMVLINSHVYGGHGQNKGLPVCIDLVTGEIRWGGKVRGVGGGSAAVTAVGENLIFRYETGELGLLRATPDGYELNGAMNPEFQQGKSWAHPVICGGKMFLREQDRLMCYQL